MRLDNLPEVIKEDIKNRNTIVLIRALREELEEIKEELIDLPMEVLPELRGRAKTLRRLLELLGE